MTPTNHATAVVHCALLEKLETRVVLSSSGILPVAGDFDGDGVDSTVLYDGQTGTFYITDVNQSGFAESAFRFGPAGNNWIPLAGDFDGDGLDGVGLYDPNTGRFFIKNDLAAGPADAVFRLGPGGANWKPVAGDFDGDGVDSVGVYDTVGGKYFLKNSLSGGAADVAFRFGPKGTDWQPLAGDWDGNGVDDVGLYDPAGGNVYLRNSLTAGAADSKFRFGPTASGWTAVAGNWDADATMEVGLYSTSTGKFFLNHDNTAGAADSVHYVVPALSTIPGAAPTDVSALAATTQLTAAEVELLLDRAAAASASEDFIIAVVDRGGRILGVRAEAGVLSTIPDIDTLVFAIDGAVAKARTAAFFSNGDPANGTLAPLTSRTVRFISQSTVTQREVESNPNITDPDSIWRGPGFVAPIGLGGHFPPDIMHTPPVDLFGIEHTNRDSIVHPGPDRIKGTADDVMLPNRFNVESAFIPMGQGIEPPESYGFTSGLRPGAQSRGIATLPGGIPLFRDTDGDGQGDTLIGGIGVFFPGPDGFATHEQGFVQSVGQTTQERTNAPRVLEAEWIAFAAAGGSLGAEAPVGSIGGFAAVESLDLPFGRLDLVGVQLEVFGPHPMGVQSLVALGRSLGVGASTGANQDVMPGMETIAGAAVPQGWLVLPHASPGGALTTADVQRIIAQAVEEALLVRAAVRLPLGSRTRMVLSVTDTDGNVLGLFRMPDATVFSIDVATAKARNTAYYADAAAIVAADLVDANGDGIPDLPPGVAMTNRTFRFLAEARFPSGVDAAPSGPFSILNDPGINPLNAENLGAPLPASAYTTVLGFDAFNPGTNFRDPDDILNQNGVVFFPGSVPVYKGGLLVGGFGVSGDGVDQDDVVTAFGAEGFGVPTGILRADEVFVRGVRLPYQKFLRNPEG